MRTAYYKSCIDVYMYFLFRILFKKTTLQKVICAYVE